jgi:hypothetical protein
MATRMKPFNRTDFVHKISSLLYAAGHHDEAEEEESQYWNAVNVYGLIV